MNVQRMKWKYGKAKEDCYVCVCVREREREEKKKEVSLLLDLHLDETFCFAGDCSRSHRDLTDSLEFEQQTRIHAVAPSVCVIYLGPHKLVNRHYPTLSTTFTCISL